MLKSSKTWPSIITMTVVQLKFDKKGKYSYSTIANIGESDKPQVFPQPQLTSVLNERSPFKKKLDAQYPHNCDHKEEILARKNLTSQQLGKTSMSRRQKNDLNATITKPTVTTPTGKICLCELELNGIHNNRKRSELLKIDNWDYVYKEKSFRTNSDQPQDEKNPKSPPNCNHGYLSGLGAQKIDTIFRHYYPESGFAWVILTVAILIAILAHGLQLVSVLFLIPAQEKFKMSKNDGAGLASFSTAVAWFFSPLTIGLCKRKSTRVTAVLGGLIISLGCLFTSFATQFHQLYLSYGIIFGLGVGISRDCSSVMVGQYFKRKREFVEILIVVGSGMGIVVMSTFVKNAIEAIGWRLGMQAVTVCIGGIFILATCYRSASLYHPQRRAILHLKNQKRKIKDKSHKFEGPPFFDFSTLKSKTFRILLLSTTITAFGINTPLFYLAHHLADNVKDKVLTLHIYLGCAWMLGCSIFGLLVVKKSVDCRIAKQYLCQAAILICGLAMLMLTTVEGNYQTYLFFVWVYGVFVGGYHYSLKMLTFEKVRARNFAQAWGFVQFSQALPIALGVPFAGYLNSNLTENSGYYFCSASSIVGSLTLFLIDFHKRNVPSPKEGITEQNSQTHSCTQECRKLSFQNHQPVLQTTELIPAIKFVPSINVVLLNATNGEKPELTCISEEV